MYCCGLHRKPFQVQLGQYGDGHNSRYKIFLTRIMIALFARTKHAFFTKYIFIQCFSFVSVKKFPNFKCSIKPLTNHSKNSCPIRITLLKQGGYGQTVVLRKQRNKKVIEIRRHLDVMCHVYSLGFILV